MATPPAGLTGTAPLLRNSSRRPEGGRGVAVLGSACLSSRCLLATWLASAVADWRRDKGMFEV